VFEVPGLKIFSASLKEKDTDQEHLVTTLPRYKVTVHYNIFHSLVVDKLPPVNTGKVYFKINLQCIYF